MIKKILTFLLLIFLFGALFGTCITSGLDALSETEYVE